MIGSLLLSLTLTVGSVNARGPLLKVHLRIPPSGHPTKGVYIARGELTMGDYKTTLHHLRRITITGMDPIVLSFQERIAWKKVTPHLLDGVVRRNLPATFILIWSPPRGDPMMRASFRITPKAIHLDDMTFNPFWKDVTWTMKKAGEITITTTLANPLSFPLHLHAMHVATTLNGTPIKSRITRSPESLMAGDNTLEITLSIPFDEWQKLLFSSLVHLRTPNVNFAGDLVVTFHEKEISIPFDVDKSVPLSPAKKR